MNVDIRTLVAGLVLLFVFNAAPIDAQTTATKADTIRMSNLLSERTGVPTVAAVVPRGQTYDIKVLFMGNVTNYKGVMGAVIGAVGQVTREAKYSTDYCYITTNERGTERILTKDIREAQALALAGKVEDGWNHFVSKKKVVGK